MTSIGLRPALLFFSLAGVNVAASISARKLSNGTTRSIISSGSPFAEITAGRPSVFASEQNSFHRLWFQNHRNLGSWPLKRQAGSGANWERQRKATALR